MIDVCRSCASDRLEEVLDLGSQRLSDFPDTPDQQPPRYPLTLVRCLACGLAQLSHTVSPGQLYHDRYGFYSGVNETIRADLRDIARTARRYVPHGQTWLDIASNDGTLLSFVPESWYRVGVDPVAKFAPMAEWHADRIIADYFHPDLFGRTRFDVVTSVSVFYDLDDPGAFVEGVRQVLHPDGIWVIQQNYLPAMLEATAFDNISHEHLTYWSFGPLSELLNRHGLEVLDVSVGPVNGGVFRTVVGHAGVRTPAPSVDRQFEIEYRAGLDNPLPWHAFTHRSRRAIGDLMALVTRAVYEEKTVDLYGASTRGAVIWQAAQLGPGEVRWAVERNLEKVGRWYGPVGVPIVSEQQMREDPPDVLLCGPWWLRDQFIERERAFLEGGGRMVFPLPRLEVVGS